MPNTNTVSDFFFTENSGFSRPRMLVLRIEDTVWGDRQINGALINLWAGKDVKLVVNSLSGHMKKF